MTKLFLAAGVAALAIAAPATAKPGGGGGDDKGGKGAQVPRGGGGGTKFEARGGGLGGAKFEARGGGGERAQKQREQRFEASKKANEQRFEQAKKAREQRFEFAKKANEQRFESAKKAREQRFEHNKRFAETRDKQREKAMERARKFDDGRFENQKRVAEQRSKAFERAAKVRGIDRADDRDDRWVNARGLVEGCPPGLAKKGNGCMPPGQAKKFIGQPVDALARVASLSALPPAISYFYPDNDDHYYRYGNGYLYQVDRETSLVNSLLPLLAGGLLPGQMFPTNYAPSYVPSYVNAFYQDTPYIDYRYANGNVYGVDPYTGMIQDVVPLYAQGYGVGSALPADYGYYNVPLQYRDMYANTADTNYWYAPGAIYQVDPQTQLITSVAALLAPGLSVGQQLPAGYGVYNVPYDYRQTYYDTPNAWYRYNNGNIYQVDPTTQLVTALVASLLT